MDKKLLLEINGALHWYRLHQYLLFGRTNRLFSVNLENINIQ